jgi:NADH-quinone oxidoreductase subunit I
MEPEKKQKIQWVESPPLGLLGKSYMMLFLHGITTALKHLFRIKKVTLQSPEARHFIQDPVNYRGVHRLNKDEQGRVKCVACFLCATACPAHCIDIVAEESPWDDREKYPKVFNIDELRCIFCGMCEQACPVEAIELTSLYDLTGASREEMIFDKEKLLSVYDMTKDKEPMPSKRIPTPLSILAAKQTASSPTGPTAHPTPAVQGGHA